jgi:ribulose-phosphate 3-epimerase
VLDKARKVRAMIDAGGHNCRLEIDGGVGPGNILEVARAGVDTFVAGSAIFGAGKDTDPHRYDSVVAAMRAELAKV